MTAYPSPAPTSDCGGQQIYALGQFWPVAFVEMDRAGGLALVPNHLWLIKEDRIMVALGDLPAIPAKVIKVALDTVRLEFCHPLHASVLEAVGYREKTDSETELLAAA